MPRRQRSHVEGPHDNEERWLLTYADMITLLFVLFVVMYAISTTDIRKFVALAQSVSAAFNTDVMQGQQPISIMTGGESVPQDLGYDSSTGVVATDMRTLKAALQDYAIANGTTGEVEVVLDPEGIDIRLSDALLFSPGRAHLDETAIKVVEKVADILRPLPNRIRVEGHTDDQPPEGGLYADNWQLSTARALAVLDALRSLSVPASRLAAAGYAEFDPIVANVDDASRARNRRVDILVLYPQQPVGGPEASSLPTPGALPSLP